MAGSREIREAFKKYQENKKHKGDPIPPQLKADVIEFVNKQVRGGMTKTRAISMTGVPFCTVNNWMRPKKPRVKIKEYKGATEGVPMDEIEVTFKHPYLGDISVTGDKAKEIWNKLSEI